MKSKVQSPKVLCSALSADEKITEMKSLAVYLGRSPRSPISKLCQPDPVVVMHFWQVLIGRGPPVQPFPSCRAARTRVATVVSCRCCGNCSSPWSSAQARTTNDEEPSRSVRKPRCTAPCSWAVAAAQPGHLCCRVDAVDVYDNRRSVLQLDLDRAFLSGIAEESTRNSQVWHLGFSLR